MSNVRVMFTKNQNLIILARMPRRHDVVCCDIHLCWITPMCKVAGDALILEHVLWLPWRWENAGGDLGVRILRVTLGRAKVHNEFVECRRRFAHLTIPSGVETFAGSSFSHVDVPHPLWDKWIGHPLSFKVVDVLSELAAVCRVYGNFLYQAIKC